LREDSCNLQGASAVLMGRKEGKVRRSAFLAITCAGCVTYFSADESTGKVDITGERLRSVPWHVDGRIGMSAAGLFFRYSDDRKALENGLYADVRYRYEFNPNFAIEASAGSFHADSKTVLVWDPVGGVYVPVKSDNVDCAPLRLTVAFGGASRNYPVSWFIGGGGGYFLYGSEHSSPGRPVDNEWATHVHAGLEIKPNTHIEFPVCTRLDVGYVWPGESKKEMVLAGISVFFGF